MDVQPLKSDVTNHLMEASIWGIETIISTFSSGAIISFSTTGFAADIVEDTP
jgi:hypothetical protein